MYGIYSHKRYGDAEDDDEELCMPPRPRSRGTQPSVLSSNKGNRSGGVSSAEEFTDGNELPVSVGYACETDSAAGHNISGHVTDPVSNPVGEKLVSHTRVPGPSDAVGQAQLDSYDNNILLGGETYDSICRHYNFGYQDDGVGQGEGGNDNIAPALQPPLSGNALRDGNYNTGNMVFAGSQKVSTTKAMHGHEQQDPVTRAGNIEANTTVEPRISRESFETKSGKENSSTSRSQRWVIIGGLILAAGIIAVIVLAATGSFTSTSTSAVVSGGQAPSPFPFVSGPTEPPISVPSPVAYIPPTLLPDAGYTEPSTVAPWAPGDFTTPPTAVPSNIMAPPTSGGGSVLPPTPASSSTAPVPQGGIPAPPTPVPQGGVPAPPTPVPQPDSYCGNGIVDTGAGEECDPNASPSGCPGGQYCHEDECYCAGCGNGRIDDGEQCDPFAEPDDGCGTQAYCTSSCSCIAGCSTDSDCPVDFVCSKGQCIAVLVCGDGLIGDGEECDPNASPSGCPGGQYCDEDECYCVGCGNGVIDSGEVCDYEADPNGCPGGGYCGRNCECTTGAPTTPRPSDEPALPSPTPVPLPDTLPPTTDPPSKEPTPEDTPTPDEPDDTPPPAPAPTDDDDASPPTPDDDGDDASPPTPDDDGEDASPPAPDDDFGNDDLV